MEVINGVEFVEWYWVVFGGLIGLVIGSLLPNNK